MLFIPTPEMPVSHQTAILRHLDFAEATFVIGALRAIVN
jgi:hypothetical protein